MKAAKGFIIWGLLLLLIPVLFVLTGPAKSDVEKYEKYKLILKPLPASPPIPADNTMTPEKIKLGEMLYWDRRVSKTGATSCGFCHHPAYYGVEPMRKSVGINGEIHKRNAQTVLNAGYLKVWFAAGEAPTLEAQALGAVKSHVATRSWPKEVAERLNRIPGYKELSMNVFGEPLTEENIGKAMAAFMRTLNTPDYPLARWLNGDDNAMTEQQKRGMATFVDKGCITCHSGPNFSNSTYQRIMVPGGEKDLGRYKVTNKEEDKYLFRVYSHLNVTETPPYFHNGSVDDLRTVIKIMGEQMLKIELTDKEDNPRASYRWRRGGLRPRAYALREELTVRAYGRVLIQGLRWKRGFNLTITLFPPGYIPVHTTHKDPHAAEVLI
jgi:cytochrome c peroxidase